MDTVPLVPLSFGLRRYPGKFITWRRSLQVTYSTGAVERIEGSDGVFYQAIAVAVAVAAAAAAALVRDTGQAAEERRREILRYDDDQPCDWAGAIPETHVWFT